MVSTAVMDHVLQKIAAAIQQEEAVSADMRIAYIKENLSSFKAEVEMFQRMADLGVETSEQMLWRKRVADLACLVEDFVDSSTYPLNLPQVERKKLDNIVKEMFTEIQQQITALSQEQPWYDMDTSTAESYGSMAGYDPCLPVATTEASEIYGVEISRDKLASLLLEGEKHLKALIVSGLAGLGKTTLAIEINRQIEAEFDCHATVMVSQRPDMMQLLQHILLQIRPNSPQPSETSRELQQLIEGIREYLQDKRYLILLDDVWEKLSEINSVFPNNNCGSRIIMTTRVRRLAYLDPCGCDVTVYEMERLGLPESENLLSRVIYGSRDGCPDFWREDSYQTARTYGGVPLATVAIAHLVKARLIYPNYTWVLAPELEQRFLLSYNYLDPCLKAHMMLLCMFPWDFRIERNLLIRIWKAEGYANSWSRGESTAKDILKQLIDQNVILPINHEDISEVEAWTVYYVMFEAILRRSAEDNFLITSSNLMLLTTNKVRRLALHSHYSQLEFEECLDRLDLSFVSSLSIFWKANRVSLDKFQNLRVLEILGWKELKDDDLYDICEMLLLRYLSLRNTQVSYIPQEIKNLCHLETLDLRKTQVKMLPMQVGQLPKLSDLLVGDPLSDSRVGIHTGFRYFESLRTLETVHLRDAWLLLDSLQNLKEVAIMCPFQESSYSQDKFCQSLKQCCGLESLTFYSSLGCSMEFLHSLRDPPHSLRKLRITGRLVNVPKWIAKLENLTLLQIRVCQLEPRDMETLCELPSLQRLLLGLDFLPEQAMRINGFPSLERFSVDCRVPWLKFQPGAVPRLTELELKFREGPANEADSAPSGLHHIPNLKRVAIYYSSWCESSPSVKATVGAIVTAVRDHPWPVKLFINGSTDVQGVNPDQAEIRGHARNASGHAGPSSSLQ